MRAMILAAGRGERMRPLTDHTPKPLLPVAGKPLLAWHLERLANAGFRDVIINHAWLGEQIEQTMGDGDRYGLRLCYSPETQALETAGGIAQALPFFKGEPFLVINGDIWCDWDPRQAVAVGQGLQQNHDQLWMLLVDNPAQHPDGDFTVDDEGRPVEKTGAQAEQTYTFSGIGVYQPSLFEHIPQGQPFRLLPLLQQAMRARSACAARYEGQWHDVGTPERLRQLNELLLTTRR
jgi:MurNAc alpha-1-phosphate uridylyltransferase